MAFCYRISNKDQNIISYTLDDGSYVSFPVDLANTDYQSFLIWCKEGNTPLPYSLPSPVNHLKDLQEAKEFTNNLIKSTAYQCLQPTDWYIIRFIETATEIPEKVVTFRATIKTEISSKISTVESKETLEDLKDYLRSNEYSTWTEL